MQWSNHWIKFMDFYLTQISTIISDVKNVDSVTKERIYKAYLSSIFCHQLDSSFVKWKWIYKLPQSDVCYKVLKAYFGEIFESVNKVSFIYWEGVPVIFQGTEPSPNPLVILNHKPKNQPEIDNFDSVKKSSFGENMDISKKASFGRKGFSKALSLHHQSKNHSKVINFESVNKASFGENSPRWFPLRQSIIGPITAIHQSVSLGGHPSGFE